MGLFANLLGVTSEVDQELKSKRQQIIEEERIRVLKESLVLFYDKLMEKYPELSVNFHR